MFGLPGGAGDRDTVDTGSVFAGLVVAGIGRGEAGYGKRGVVYSV